MPVCNKCKKQSNCLTIDPCDHCGAKDWDQTTVLPSRTFQARRTAKVAENFGCLLTLVVLGVIGFGIYYVFFMSDIQKLSSKYNVPAERVIAPPKPHGCAFTDAPLGDKHCHYDKHVYVYDKNAQAIEIDGKPQTCSAGCGPAHDVVQAFDKVEE